MTDIKTDFDEVTKDMDHDYLVAIFNPPSPRALTDEDKMVRARIVGELYKMGYSTRQIGKAIGYSYQWVADMLRDYDYEVRPWPGIQARRQAGVLGA